jgi:hypothetical protein
MVNSVGFLLGVFLIALFCWYLRSRIESDPEPFFLNLTFFAFAGQFIKFAELTADSIIHGRWLPGFGTLLILLGVSTGLVIGQARVMRVHMEMTGKHYRDVLTRKLKRENNHQVERWAIVLLRITGVDLFPGGYRWLKLFSPEEPRTITRELAVFALPRDGFRSKKGIAPEDLVLDVTKERRIYWWLYVTICIFSWGLFVYAIIFAQGRF